MLPFIHLANGVVIMERLGMITIGQAPRNDVAPIIEKYLEGRAELVQVGVLDGMTKEFIEKICIQIMTIMC